MINKERDFSKSLVNILLEEARKDYRRQKYEEMAKLEAGQISDTAKQSNQEDNEEIISKLENLQVTEKSRTESKDTTISV